MKWNEKSIERSCAVTVCHDSDSVRSAEETTVENFSVLETVTVFVVENSEESLLKNLWIFLKQTATPPPDLLVFLIAYFIPPTSNSSVKTISISADKDFSPLSRNLFLKNVKKYENRL